jgi:hypothetical protein
MKNEIREAVEFLRKFIAKYGQLNQMQIDLFASKLQKFLEYRYVNHWYESNPMKGQAFRCLRLKRGENYVDPVFETVLKETHLNLNELGLPNDFTLWIDPGEVSVRFGDQMGYTYTIAKLKKSILEEHSDNEKEDNKQARFNEKFVVQNSAEIFDDKLTAFIRQNSSCNKTNSNERKSQLIQDEDNDDLNINTLNLEDADKFYEQLTALSAERKAISPPATSFSPNKSKNINIHPHAYQKVPNCLSYNDSCYFSSSSSSCASSFGSNLEENNYNAWFRPANIEDIMSSATFPLFNTSSLNPTYDSFDANIFDELKSENNKNLTFSNQLRGSLLIPDLDLNVNNINNNHINNHNNNNNNNFKKITGNNNMKSALEINSPSYPNYLLLNNQQYSNNFSSVDSNIFNSSNINMNNFIDPSSDRSDTPNSNITTSSSTSYFGMGPSPVSSYSFNSKNNMKNFRSTTNNQNYIKQNTMIDSSFLKESPLGFVNKEDVKSASSSSDSSTKTTINMDHEEMTNHTEKATNKPSESQNEKENKLIVESKNKENSDKKESKETYCGYVESFPYYYKLNRLYNALAVQKIQAERMKKNGVISNTTTNSPASVMAALASLSTAQAAGLSPNHLGQSQLRSITKNKNNMEVTSSNLSSTPPLSTSQMASSPLGQLNLNGQSKNNYKSNQSRRSPNNINNLNNQQMNPNITNEFLSQPNRIPQKRNKHYQQNISSNNSYSPSNSLLFSNMNNSASSFPPSVLQHSSQTSQIGQSYQQPQQQQQQQQGFSQYQYQPQQQQMLQNFLNQTSWSFNGNDMLKS